MKCAFLYLPILAAVIGLTGCETIPPGAERGAHGTMAYEVLIDASPAGARIQANGADLGNTPVRLKIFGDPDGTFHDFGAPWYVIKAVPIAANQFEQVRFFGTGRGFGPEDPIPKQISFDMNRPAPVNPPYGPPIYGTPYPYYYGPPPYYYGPHYRHRW